MRLVQVAKLLNMTGQQLRKELTEVNFGVKPTDREVSETLAQGIIRFLARKYNIEIDPSIFGETEVDDTDNDTDSEDGDEQDEEDAPSEDVPKEDTSKKTVKTPSKQVSGEPLKVLRKLTLEDVSKDAISREKKKMTVKVESRAARKQRLDEERKKREEERRKPKEQKQQQQIKRKEGIVNIPSELSVKEFAEKTGVQVPDVIKAMLSNGIMATITQAIDFDTASIIAAELGVQVEREHDSASAEHIMGRNLTELIADDAENLTERPPIVVIMGHVDHGKTAILDAIRETDVVAGEHGGITQHIGAYQVEHHSKTTEASHKITFLDTPGHEAFTAMRARGAQVTDIAIIVVSAEEGVKPTTIEAIAHAKDAGVPIIVAVNKIDKPNANPDKVKGELAGEGLQTEDWGGKIPCVHTSAITKQGIEDLLDTIVLVADEAKLKANPSRAAVGTVIESHLDKSHGPLATIVVNTGTLNSGDAFVCGLTTGKIRTMMDAHGDNVKLAPPTLPVRITGFSDVPEVGDILQVMNSEQEARKLVDEVRESHERGKKRSFADLVSRLSEGKLTQLKVVLKADSHGSLEAIEQSLQKIKTEGIGVKVIYKAVGDVSETDVMMASASDGVVIAFHTQSPTSVNRVADREGVKIKEYLVLYTLLEEIEALCLGLLVAVEEEEIIGNLDVKGVFWTKRKEQIIGGRITNGVMKRLPFRLMRNGEEVGNGRITSVKSGEKDVKEMKEGADCGLRTETTEPILEGDMLEVFTKVTR